MILSDKDILEAMERGTISIDPFDRSKLGTNSYDVHLSEHFAVYTDEPLDARKDIPLRRFEIPKSGYVLQPGQLYLASTVEYTETLEHVPFLEGKSSTGRLGIDIHATAGKGDVGFKNHWTLEISAIRPVRIYPGMPIAQLIYFTVSSQPQTLYCDKSSAKYNQTSPLPQPSSMWKNRF